MSISKRISILHQVGLSLQNPEHLDNVLTEALAANPWFEPQFVQQSLAAVSTAFLNEEKLADWLKPYCIEDDFQIKQTVGIICAGNIPLVGFHDFLCCYVLGIPVKLKLSSKDQVLMRFVINKIIQLDDKAAATISFVEKLTDFDAVIATGSGSANRYFEHYFGKYPNTLRSNRVSVAVLNGNEPAEELAALADDVFLYFGLGCRNVAKIFVPQQFNVEELMPHFDSYKWLHQNAQFMNNYDYNRTILLMNKTPHLANEFVMLQESKSLHSPIATVFYEHYDSAESVNEYLKENADKIQCVVGNGSGMIPFGKAQTPALSDYADGKDTIAFLLGL